MKYLAAILLVLAGAGLILAAIVRALAPLIGLYQGAMGDPLGQPEGTEQAAADQMFSALILGAVGALPFIAGVIWLKVLAVRRIARAARGR